MKAIIECIGHFFHGMDGWKECPKCGNKDPKLISTTNEYDHYCQKCDIRYTNDGLIYEGE